MNVVASQLTPVSVSTLPSAEELDRSLRTASPAEVIAAALKTVGRAPRNLPSYDYYVGLANRARYSPEKTKTILGWRPVTDRALLVTEGIAKPVAEFLS